MLGWTEGHPQLTARPGARTRAGGSAIFLDQAPSSTREERPMRRSNRLKTLSNGLAPCGNFSGVTKPANDWLAILPEVEQRLWEIPVPTRRKQPAPLPIYSYRYLSSAASRHSGSSARPRGATPLRAASRLKRAGLSQRAPFPPRPARHSRRPARPAARLQSGFGIILFVLGERKTKHNQGVQYAGTARRPAPRRTGAMYGALQHRSAATKGHRHPTAEKWLTSVTSRCKYRCC